MIFVECKPDLTLIKSLMKISRKEIRHGGNKTELCKKLEREMNCKGLIDEDPGSVQPPYLGKTNLEDDLPRHGLKLLHDKINNNYLVIICPMLEDWLLEGAKEVSIDIRKYKLPDNAVKLHEIININLDKFEMLIEDLKECERFEILRTFFMR